MYRGFNLELPSYKKANHDQFYETGSSLFKEQKSIIETELEDLILKDGSLDGTKLQNEWFPNVEADLFLSHSHIDEESVIVFAGYLKDKFEITSFIDSTVWGYGNDLLKKLDNQFCRIKHNDQHFYDYDLRNLSTSHVHLMISGALAKMIDTTECVFFLNTPNSVKPNEVITSTLSPWLYSEILTTQIIRKRLPTEHINRRRNLTKSFSEGRKLNEGMSVTHQIETRHLTKINVDNEFFKKWQKQKAGSEFSLDALYKMYPIETT